MNYRKMVSLLEDIRKGLQAEAEQHHPGERCKEGTHWNEDHHKCEELPPDLLHLHNKAWKKTSGARSSTSHADSRSMSSMDAWQYHGKAIPDYMAKDHAQAHVAHTLAAAAHKKAAHAAEKAGFHPLAKQHKEMTRSHVWNAKVHGNEHHSTPAAIATARQDWKNWKAQGGT